MATVLSWDCANRTLGSTSAVVDLAVFSTNLGRFYDVGATRETVLAGITGVKIGVHDVIGGKIADNDIVARGRKLRDFLTTGGFDQRIVGIEAQPPKIGQSTNGPATGVSYQLAFHFADRELYMVDPKHKQEYCFGGIKFADFLAEELARIPEGLPRDKLTRRKKAARYRAGKKHAAALARWLLHGSGIGDDIAARDYNNAADALLNLIAMMETRVGAVSTAAAVTQLQPTQLQPQTSMSSQ